MRGVRGRAGREPLAGVGALGTAAFHAVLAAAVLGMNTVPARRVSPPAYRVELLAGPPPAPSTAGAAPATAPAVAQPAQPTRPARRPEPAAPATAAPPAPATRVPAPAARPVAPSTSAGATRPGAGPSTAQPAAAAANAAAPGAVPGTGSDAATVRTEGVEFPFPGYLRNLVAQVFRRWRPPQGNTTLEAEVFFIVHRDGAVSGIRFIKRSGSFAFDLEAQGAIESAARASAFGPLPEGFDADALPVSFFFSPQGIR